MLSVYQSDWLVLNCSSVVRSVVPAYDFVTAPRRNLRLQYAAVPITCQGLEDDVTSLLEQCLKMHGIHQILSETSWFPGLPLSCHGLLGTGLGCFPCSIRVGCKQPRGRIHWSRAHSWCGTETVCLGTGRCTLRRRGKNQRENTLPGRS